LSIFLASDATDLRGVLMWLQFHPVLLQVQQHSSVFLV
jgi:hypothetical protein